MDNLQSLIHDCDDMPKDGVSVRVGGAYLGSEESRWCLFLERLATEEDLEENHYLEEVGETIWTTAVEIKFCPYCGRELFSAQSGSPAKDFGRFVHIDSSGWMSQRR